MTEWSAYISTFLSLISVTFILVAINLGNDLSQDLGASVYGKQIAKSDAIRAEFNNEYTIGESLTRAQASREMVERTMGNYCARILIFEGHGTMSNPASAPLSTAVAAASPHHNRDVADSANVLKNQFESTYASLQLDKKWRLMYSTQNAYPAFQSDCYYFIDYVGAN